jgi:hypothetical protein
MIAQAHPAAAQIATSDTLAPSAAPPFERPIFAGDNASRGGGYWEWSNGGYNWNAGNWGSTIGLSDGAARPNSYSREGSSGGNVQEQRFSYHTTVSQVSSDGNAGSGR